MEQSESFRNATDWLSFVSLAKFRGLAALCFIEQNFG